MSDESVREKINGNLPNDVDHNSDAICRLLTGLSQEEIHELQRRLGSDSSFKEEVSRVFSDAARINFLKDDSFAKVISPVIADGVEQSIKKDSKKFVDILAPIMGPAIRASVINTVREHMESMDKVLTQKASFQGFKWWLEAKRTGRSHNEVILYHTLKYRVEHLFLINRNDGCLLYTSPSPRDRTRSRMPSSA